MPRILLLALLLSTLQTRAEYPTVLLGPKIASIDTMDGGSLLDVVNQIKEAIRQDHDLPIAIEIDIPDEELAKVPAKLALKKVPATIALYYVAERGLYEFFFQNGIWTLRNTPIIEQTYLDDILTLKIENITPEELTALGLKINKDNSVSPLSGPKWPKADFGSAFKTEAVILIQAYRHETDALRALLTLHRQGYPIPPINTPHKEIEYKSSVNRFEKPTKTGD